MTTTATEQLASTTDDARRRPDLRALGLRFGVAFAFGLALAASLALAGTYAFEQRYANRVLPGVRVGSTDLSGLTAAEARARLSEAYASLGNGRIIVVGPDG